ncbi:MAG: SDR family oxidoreductase [Sulfuritalea sp.]|nr:SDR family oxidoreductase [Sulfuritalea sp.]
MKSRVLITGGFGYVGSRAAQYLAARGDEVLLGTRSIPRSIHWMPGAEVVHMDWHSEQKLQSVCSGVTAILHLAAMNEADSAADPVAALLANGVATARLLEAAKRAQVQRFIYLSSAHVYGAPLTGRIAESLLPCPRHPYATSHRAAEDCVLAAQAAEQLAGIVLRSSNGFGVPVHSAINCWSLIVNDLCRQAVMNRRLVLRSAGLHVRDFIPLHDTVRALSHSLDLDGGKVGDGLFNIGGECTLRVIDLALEIIGRCEAVLGYTPTLERPSPVPGAPVQWLDYRMDKFKSTGFSLSGSRQAEIDATLLFCRDNFGNVS